MKQMNFSLKIASVLFLAALTGCSTSPIVGTVNVAKNGYINKI